LLREVAGVVYPEIRNAPPLCRADQRKIGGGGVFFRLPP